MKKLLLFAVLCIGAMPYATLANDSISGVEINNSDPGQVTFTFMNTVPAQIKQNEGIDLSFYVNHAVVFQYRYRLVAPKETPDLLESGLIRWSEWINRDIVEIKIPKLSQPGKYNFTIEYVTHEGPQVRTFEKQFGVYQEKVNQTTSRPSETTAKNTAVQKETKSVTVLVPVVAEPQKPDQGSIETKTSKAALAEKTVAENAEISPPRETTETKVTSQPSREIQDTVKIREEVVPAKDYDKVLLEALEAGDENLFREALGKGAVTTISPENGGTIFHLMVGKVESVDLLNQIGQGGISINKPDNSGNTPLHLSILKGRTSYALNLIQNGANLNLLNSTGLSPLHLAACKNNLAAAKGLIKAGADVNIKGNSNYTPLHIAAELNNPDIAQSLLTNRAKSGEETAQKLDAVTIAKIQGNKEVEKLIKSNGKYIFKPVQPYTLTSLKSDPAEKVTFALPYDENLLRKRKTDRIIQLVAGPLTVVGLGTSAYMWLQAEDYYAKSQDETLPYDDRESYWNQMKKFDTYMVISAGVSVVSLYAFIHSSIHRSSVTKRMKKTF